MSDADNPYRSPESEAVDTPARKRKPSIAAIAIITVACYALAFFMTPADPYSFLLGCAALILLALSSYFAGYLRGTR